MGSKDDGRRKKENDELIRRMRNKENLCHTDLSAYRWAPRSIIKKDKELMELVNGTK